MGHGFSPAWNAAGTKPHAIGARSPDLKPSMAESRNGLVDFENAEL
jgi:hypothetical protein